MITVFGSANMDLVAYTDRAPARGETVTGREFRTVPGGKGLNQAVAAARAGGGVRFLGAVGEDLYADQLTAALGAAGVRTGMVRQVPGPSGIAHIVVDGAGANSVIVVAGANGAVAEPTADERSLIRRSSALLLQLELPLSAVIAAAEEAHAAGVPVILTPAPAQPLPDRLLAAVDVLLPNEHEAGDADPEKALAGLLERVPEVVITLGARGVLHGSRTGAPQFVPALPVDTVDTTGAGDTFAGAFAVARVEGQPTGEALQFATAAAALSVTRAGASVSMPTRAEIDELLAGRP